MNSNVSLFSVPFPPILHLVLPGFYSLLILQNNNNKNAATENTTFYTQFCCWQIKIFIKIECVY